LTTQQCNNHTLLVNVIRSLILLPNDKLTAQYSLIILTGQKFSP